MKKMEVATLGETHRIIDDRMENSVVNGRRKQRMRQGVPGRFDPAVTVIMLSPGVTGSSRHLDFASESLLCSSRFLLDPNILSG